MLLVDAGLADRLYGGSSPAATGRASAGSSEGPGRRGRPVLRAVRALTRDQADRRPTRRDRHPARLEEHHQPGPARRRAGRGVSRLDGALFAADTEAMLDCLARLGAGIDVEPDNAAVTVDGIGGELPGAELELYAGQAGTTARFLLPVLAVGPGVYRLDADRQLRRRPMGPASRRLDRWARRSKSSNAPGIFPCSCTEPGGRRRRRSTASRCGRRVQPVPVRAAAGRPVPARRPRGRAHERAGLPALRRDDRGGHGLVRRRAGRTDAQQLRRRPRAVPGRRHQIEPDASAASYFLAAAAICGGRVEVAGLGPTRPRAMSPSPTCWPGWAPRCAGATAASW